MIKSSRLQGIVKWVLNTLVAKCPSRRVRHACYRPFVKLAPGANIMMGLELRKLVGIEIGTNSNVNPNCMIDSRGGKVLIGNYVDIAPEVNIWTLEHDMNDPNFGSTGGPVRVGDFAWLCNRAIILPGVKIGQGAVVAAGAVVTKDVEAWSVVGGIPAKKIGERKQEQNPRKAYRPWFI